MKAIRCFISIEIDPTVKNSIEQYIKKLIQNNFLKNIKWVKSENMHITLAFLGETPINKLDRISEIIKGISARYSPFTINLQGTGFFPNIRQPRVLWIGIEKEPALYDIKHEIDIGLDRLGLFYDRKPFSPHLTLGRFKSFYSAGDLSGLPDFKACFLAKEIALVKSELFKDGPVYTNIFTCCLKKLFDSNEGYVYNKFKNECLEGRQ